MTTFNGPNENLKFTCGSCGDKEFIIVDLCSSDDMRRLQTWLFTHSANGGKYEGVPALKCAHCHETIFKHQDRWLHQNWSVWCSIKFRAEPFGVDNGISQ